MASSPVRFVFKAMVASMAGIIVVYFGVGLLLADAWTVETSRTLAAPPERVGALIGDLARWPDWAKLDVTLGPETQRTLEGAAGQPGQAIVWRGQQGTARFTCTALSADAAEFEFSRQLADGSSPGSGSATRLAWAPEGGGTKVTWRDSGSWPNLAGRWFGWFGALQESLRRVQNGSLGALEQAAALPK